MFEIDGPGSVGGKFVGGNRQAGTPPSIVTADWLNMMQAELAAILSAAGIAPDKENNSQVLAAIRNLQSRYTRMTLSVGQSIPNGIETVISWPAPLNDSAGAATSSGVTVPPGYSLIIVTAQISFTGNSSGSRKIRILKNDVGEGAGLGAMRVGTADMLGDGTDVAVLSAAGGPYPVVPGDRIKVAVVQTSGITLNATPTNTWMTCHFIK